MVQRIGNRYRILEELGEGGQGRVWAGEDRWNQDRPVAIKRLTRESGERIRGEFAALRTLRHPHIVSALDLISSEGQEYLVMQRAFGVSLSRWAEARSLEEVLRGVAPLFHALSHVHARGWVHLDPTSSNIIVDPETGHALLIDLGTVQPLDSTLVGGTPGFIAPELLKGHGVSPAADVYTLGRCVQSLFPGGPSLTGERGEALSGLVASMVEPSPELRPSAHGVARRLWELVGEGEGDFLNQPLVSLPLSGREEELAHFQEWLGGEATPLLVGGEPGCGVTCFLDHCLMAFKLRGLISVSVKSASKTLIHDIFFQVLSSVGAECEWLQTHGAVLKGMVKHPALDPFESEDHSGETRRERVLTALLLLEELGEQLPLGVVVHRGARGEEGEEWRYVEEVWSNPETTHTLRLVLEVSSGRELVLLPLGTPGVESLLRVAYGFPPPAAWTEHLLNLTGGRPGLLLEALKVCRRDGRAPLLLEAHELTDGGAVTQLPEALHVFSVATGAIPAGVVQAHLRRCSSSALLGEALESGWLVALGDSEQLNYMLPGVYQGGPPHPEWYQALAEAYLAEGYVFEASLLAIEGDPKAGTTADVATLLAEAPPNSRELVYQRIYEAKGASVFGEEQLREWATLASNAGDVTGCRSALLALGEGEESGWAAGLLGRTLHKSGHFAECLEVTSAHLHRLDCRLVRARALLAKGELEETLALLESERGEGAEYWDTLGSVLCQLGRLEQGCEHLERAVEIAETTGDTDVLGRAWHGLGIGYQRLGDGERAGAAYQRALQCSNQLTRISRTLNYGTLLLDLGYWAEAERRFRESLSSALVLGNVREQARIIVNLSNLLVLSGQLDQGERLASEGVALCAAGGLLYPQAMLFLILSEACLEREEGERAGGFLREAGELLTERSDPMARAEWSLLRARLAFWEGDEAEVSERLTELERTEWYQELGWRVLFWRSYFHLMHKEAINADEKAALAEALRESQRADNPRFEWKFQALLGELVPPATEKGRTELAERIGRATERWAERLSDLQREAYFKTRVRKRLLSSVTSLKAEQGAVMIEQPQIVFIRKLVSINRRLAREHDVEALLDLIVDAAIELVGAERGFILLNKEKGVEISVARNLGKSSLSEGSEGISRSIAMEVLRTGERVLTTNASEDVRFAHARSVSALRLRSVLCVPLRASRRGEDPLIGVLYLDNRLHERAFGDSDRELCAALADQASIAIENARLISKIRSQESALEEKNDQLGRLNQSLQKEVALYAAQAEQALRRLREEGPSVGVGVGFEKFVGTSTLLKGALRLVERFADTDVPVLIRGESGTGKELIARALHQRSRRSGGCFVSINCGAIPNELIESELFGYKRGAFTGAVKDKGGLIRQAEGGTLFLDEIGEMPLAMQVKLLRVLQENEYRPVGSSVDVRCDIRVVSATHRDLEALILEQRFREDFFYRIQVVEIALPPLRERREDIPALAASFTEQIAGRDLKACFSEAALGMLMVYPWPGNVRELENEVRRALALSDGVVEVVDLSEKLQALREGRRAALVEGSRGTLKEIMDRFEKEVLNASLSRNSWNVKKTASDLGVSRASLYTRLNRFEIKRIDVN